MLERLNCRILLHKNYNACVNKIIWYYLNTNQMHVVGSNVHIEGGIVIIKIDYNLYFYKNYFYQILMCYFKIQLSPTPSPTPPLVKMSVSDKKKLFESAMEEHLKPSPKPGRYYFIHLYK